MTNHRRDAGATTATRPVPASRPGPVDGADALALCALGWSVVPVHGVAAGRCTCGRPDCPSPGKHPRIRWVRAQQVAARPEAVTAWWRRWPRSNLGVVTGRISGVVVLDVDPRHGGEATLAALEAAHGPVPDTVQSHTGGGGRHLWLAHPVGTVPSRPLAPGVDLKGEGGLVISPPSTHVSGDRYAWAPGAAPWERPLAPTPSWVLELARATGEPPTRSERSPGPATDADRAAFADLWAAVEVALVPGEQMVRCPFHADHHPSLHVDADRCVWFCFGCRRGGGIGALRREVERDAPPDRADPLPTLRPEIVVDVTGEGAHQHDLRALQRHSDARAPMLACLLPEPASGDRPAAIRVEVRGRLVGELLRRDVIRHHTAIERSIRIHGLATCLARLTGGHTTREGTSANVGVELLLPRPESLHCHRASPGGR